MIKLISYDIFDTIIRRSTATPQGIFAIVQEIIDASYPVISKKCDYRFSEMRYKAEITGGYIAGLRGREDITFDEIYEIFSTMSDFSKKEVDLIKELEFQVEKNNIIPVRPIIEEIKNTLKNGYKVVLISDMYFGEELIRKMLVSFDEIFLDIPIYVSSKYGFSKGTANLYRYVRREEGVRWSDWKHFGDNYISDVTVFKKQGGIASHCAKETMIECEKYILDRASDDALTQLYIGTSIYLRERAKKKDNAMIFGCSYGAAIILQYTIWYISICLNKGIRDLYFIARDGYILKIIADIVISEYEYDINTKYIYGSRDAWHNEKKKILKEYIIQEINTENDCIGFVDTQGTGKSLSQFISLLREDYNGEICCFYYSLGDCYEKKEEFYRYTAMCGEFDAIIEPMTRALHGKTVGYKKNKSVVTPILINDENIALMDYGYENYINGVIDEVREYIIRVKNNRIDIMKFDLGQKYYKYLINYEKGELLDFLCDMPFSDNGEIIEEVLRYSPKYDIDQMIKTSEFKYVGYNEKLTRKRHSPDELELVDSIKAKKKKHWNYYIINHKKLKKRVAIYGAGKVGKSLYSDIKNMDDTEIVVWVDRNYNDRDSIVCSPDDLINYDFEQIIIAIKDYMTVYDVKTDLMIMGYDENMIYWENYAACKPTKE